MKFVGGVSQSIDALVEILDQHLQTWSHDELLTGKIGRSTQMLKSNLARFHLEIEQTIVSCAMDGPGSFASTLSIGPKSQVNRVRFESEGLNDTIPSDPHPRQGLWCRHTCLNSEASRRETSQSQEDLEAEGQEILVPEADSCERGIADDVDLEEIVALSGASSSGSNSNMLQLSSDLMVMPRISEGGRSIMAGASASKMPEFAGDDVEDAPEFDNCILNPNWTGKMTWDFFVMFLVILDSIILPFQLSFKHGMPDDTFDEMWFWFTTSVFFTDVFFSFNTAVENPSEPGTWVQSRPRIACMYLTGWFSIDFFSTIPYGRLATAFGSGNSSGAVRLLKMLKFLRIMRLMRMLRMSKLRAVWERVGVRIGSIAIIQSIMLMKVLLFVVAMCHWSACLFWVIGRPESLMTDLLPPDSAADFAALPHWTTLSRRDGADQGEWTFEQKPMEEQYIFCFYWTLGVMRTMPAEVTPVNFPERIFVLLFMFFALSAFAVSVASLTQAYFKIFERGRTFNDEYFFVRMYLNRFGAQKPLEARVKQFLAHLFDRRRIMAKETNLMEKLPEVLKHDVQNMLVWHHLQKLQVVSDLGKGAIQEICAASTIADHMPGVLLCSKGEVAESTWLLCSGRLQIFDETLDRWKSSTGKYRVTVVDYETLSSPEPYRSTLTVSTATVCELLQISKATFLKFSGQHQEKITRQWKKKHNQSNKSVIKVQFSGLENTEEQNNVCASATTAVLMSGH